MHRGLIVGLVVAIGIAGYGVGYMHAKSKADSLEKTRAIAKLWGFAVALKAGERGDLAAARTAIAMEADNAVIAIADTESRSHAAPEAFLERTLQEYGAFRTRNPELYKPPSELASEKRQEWLNRDQFVSDYLTKASTRK